MTPAITCNQKPEEAGSVGPPVGYSSSSWFQYVVLDGNVYETNAEYPGSRRILRQVNFISPGSYLPMDGVQQYCWDTGSGARGEGHLADLGYDAVFLFFGSQEYLFSGEGEAYRRYRPDNAILFYGFDSSPEGVAGDFEYAFGTAEPHVPASCRRIGALVSTDDQLRSGRIHDLAPNPMR